MISAMSDTMTLSARRHGRGQGGRRSKGPRICMTIRFPEPLADAIEAGRAKTRLTTNDYVVALAELAIEAGLTPTAQPAGQERLPLTA
jgi:hypothetical protein